MFKMLENGLKHFTRVTICGQKVFPPVEKKKKEVLLLGKLKKEDIRFRKHATSQVNGAYERKKCAGDEMELGRASLDHVFFILNDIQSELSHGIKFNMSQTGAQYFF